MPEAAVAGWICFSLSLCRLSPVVGAMQPLTALQQLASLTFTRCEYGAATALPIAAMEALSRLVALDALDCTPFESAGKLVPATASEMITD